MFETAEKAASAVAHSEAPSTAINTVSSVGSGTESTAESVGITPCDSLVVEHDVTRTAHDVRQTTDVRQRKFTLTD